MPSTLIINVTLLSVQQQQQQQQQQQHQKCNISSHNLRRIPQSIIFSPFCSSSSVEKNISSFQLAGLLVFLELINVLLHF
jgi:hypothetical protein